MQGDGCTLREHLEVIERTSGQTPEQLAPQPFPHELSHIWEWFQVMSSMRQNAGFGVSRLSSEIVDWQKLEGIRLNPYELEVIRRIDSIFVTHHTEAKEAAPAD